MSTKATLHKHLGDYLKERRIQADLTQADVAQKLGYTSPQFISNFERGLCSPPLKNLKVLVKLYKLPAEEVIDLILKEQKVILSKALRVKLKK